MAVFAPCSSSRSGRISAGLLALVGLAAVAGCTEELAPLEGTTSLRVTLIEPTEVGDFGARLPDDARSVVLSIEALDVRGERATDVSADVDLYAHHLSSFTPPLGAANALAVAPVEYGINERFELELPCVFGPTFIWAEDTRRPEATYATGTSNPLWYRDPFIEDISRPLDESRLDALERSPLETKQANVTESRYGARGRLVVTGSYTQGYTVSDVECQDENATPPCTTGAYDAVFVYTFSRPEAEGGGVVLPGHLVDRFAGAVSEFKGLTEINFPQTFLLDTERRPAVIPEPVVIDPDWLRTRIELERVEAALIAVEDGQLCPLDGAFDTFGQWKLDIGRGCDSSINVITAGQVSEFDPRDYVGQTIPRVVGTLRPLNKGSFHVWIMFPRSIEDLTLPQAPGATGT